MKARRAAAPPADRTSADGPRDARAALAGTVSRSGRPPLDPAARATRTAAAVDATDDAWARPWWLDRQLRPSHVAFVPVGETGLVENLTGRNWTVVATASSGPLALVDPAGALHPMGASWSLDWAIGAEDRWHLPASEPTVRQRLVSQSPVVETACKVPSGDAVARAYAIAPGGATGDAIVFEIENESPVPFVAVFSVRPSHPLGIGSVSSIRYEHPHVLVDDRPVLLLDRIPARWSVADAPGDALIEATAGRARDDDFAPVRSTVGLATATFLVPVPHRATVRALVFPDASRRVRPVATPVIPSAGQVARGWEAHTARAARIELPDRRVTDAYIAALRGILVATSGGFPVPIGREAAWAAADEAAIARALTTVGLHDAAATILRLRCDELELDSWFRREAASIERNVAVFDAVGAHWWASRDRTVVEDVLGAVVKAAHWTERARARDPRLATAQVARAAARALAALADAVRACEQPDAADDLAAFAARFELDLDDTARSTVPPGAPVPAGPRAEDRPVATATLAGFDPAATARDARADLVARDPFAFERLAWLLRVAEPVTRWPTRVHPRLLSGSGGSGDDPAVAAEFVALVRALVVDDDTRANTLMLLPVVPPSWYGQSIDVHDLPTRLGTLSFAVRWHASRPAVLWELTTHEPTADAGVTITVPGLDPSWSTTAVRGEALLAVPPFGDQVALAEHPNTDHVPMTTLEPRVRRESADDRPIVSDASKGAPRAEPGDSFG